MKNSVTFINKAHFFQQYYKSVILLFETNACQRTLLGSIMLYLFYILCQSKKNYIMFFNIILTLGISFELIFLVKKPEKPFSVKPFKIFTIAFIIYFNQIFPLFLRLYRQLFYFSIISKIRALSFVLYAFLFMSSIISFRKPNLSSQLLIFTMAHIIGYVLGLSCKLACLNTEKGNFYYFYPCILIISNDIFAYIIGKTFGKTPLYVLSPKKTIEGFVGASFFTFIVGMILCYMKEYHNFLPDDNYMCPVLLKLGKNVYKTPALFLHNILFASFASFVAPFVGFLASAIKRSFNKKDFGKIIPGHGGLTDRMDCQLFMIYFTFLYLKLFLRTKYQTMDILINFIYSNYNTDEIKEIVNKISNFTN